MRTVVSRALAACAIATLPLAGAAFADQSPPAGRSIIAAEDSGVPSKCAGMSDPDERADCIRESLERK